MKRLALVLLCGVLIGCKGPKGDQGPQGVAGAPASFTEYNGTVTQSTFSVGIKQITSSSVVSVYYAFGSIPGAYTELGSSSAPAPSAFVDYQLNTVYFFNMTVGDKYKIVVMKPSAAPMPSGQFGDRLLW